jgi:hypothetical protein
MDARLVRREKGYPTFFYMKNISNIDILFCGTPTAHQITCKGVVMYYGPITLRNPTRLFIIPNSKLYKYERVVF